MVCKLEFRGERFEFSVVPDILRDPGIIAAYTDRSAVRFTQEAAERGMVWKGSCKLGGGPSLCCI